MQTATAAVVHVRRAMGVNVLRASLPVLGVVSTGAVGQAVHFTAAEICLELEMASARASCVLTRDRGMLYKTVDPLLS